MDGAGIPDGGPLLVAANHPTGALDGLVLAEAIRQVRPDVRILTNYLLGAVPELSGSCFFIDPFGGPQAAARSQAGLRAAHLWLRAGGALIVFPAGGVAPICSGHAVDGPWHSTVGRLALATRARVLPVAVLARNSRFFYMAGRVHPRLRTLLLGRELLKQRGTTVQVRLGRAIAADEVGAAGTAAAVTARIRRDVDDLAAHPTPPGYAELAAPVAPTLLARDVDALPASAKLLSSGAFDVFCCGAERVPHVLQEIARLREVTFRAVGEGTGRALDLDRFDAHYQHLFVWNRQRSEVVGAYRIGMSDRIVASHGIGGLYTTTLFRYDERMLGRLSPALELGRSFVRAEYQRTYNALLLLWKGIGRFVVRHPEYRVLYGPVSISSRYQDGSQQMLRAFLAQQHSDQELSALVQPVHPPVMLGAPPREAVAPVDVDDLDARIRQIEGRDGIPVLLRQYLRLNAVLLGFNVDPAFGDALDALMMVELTRLPVATLERYLGKGHAAAFLDRHVRQAA